MIKPAEVVNLLTNSTCVIYIKKIRTSIDSRCKSSKKSVITRKNPAHVEEGEHIAKEKWGEISPEKRKKLIDEFKKHLEVVIADKGCETKY